MPRTYSMTFKPLDLRPILLLELIISSHGIAISKSNTFPTTARLARVSAHLTTATPSSDQKSVFVLRGWTNDPQLLERFEDSDSLLRKTFAMRGCTACLVQNLEFSHINAGVGVRVKIFSRLMMSVIFTTQPTQNSGLSKRGINMINKEKFGAFGASQWILSALTPREWNGRKRMVDIIAFETLGGSSWMDCW